MSTGNATVVSMSPEKERELTSKILERAQLAQMTRQLKLGLSKVATTKNADLQEKVGSKESSPVINKSNVVTPRKYDRKRRSDKENIKAPLKKMSPLKKYGADDKEGISTSPLNEYNRPSTPPRVPPSSSASVINESENDKFQKPKIPTTPKPAASQSLYSSTQTHKLLTTPNRNIINTDSTIKEGGKNPNQNDAGADLLMYLATSPYVSNKNPYDRIPTTPSRNLSSADTSLHKLDTDSVVRFSHIKPSTSSPQSTFKQSAIVDSSVGSNSIVFAHSMMDSPTAFISNSPSQRRRNISSRDSGMATLGLPHVPSTPSRELRSSPNPNSFLLKTPNFNMGDYVHTLFSPSPKVNFTGNNSMSTVTDKYHSMPSSNLPSSSRTISGYMPSHNSTLEETNEK